MNALTKFSTNTPVKFDVMNKMCNEIDTIANELEQEILDRVTTAELTEFAKSVANELGNRDTKIGALELKDGELTAKNAEQDLEINKRVLQTEYNIKMTALEGKNSEQDTSIANKVNNSTFAATKLALETADTSLREDINKRVPTETYTIDKAAIEKSITDNVKVLNEKNASQDLDINSRVAKDTYATDKAATEKAIAEKTTTTLNGIKTNVNFIENKVVQDGLVYVNGATYTSPTKTLLSKEKGGYEISFNCKIISFDSTVKWLLSETDGLFRVGIDTSNRLYVQRSIVALGGKTVLKTNTNYIITLRLFGDKVVCLLDGKEEIIFSYTDAETRINNFWIPGFWDGTIPANAIINGLQIYNRILTPTEINHNFSVLNNSKAIGKINDYAISTDTHHIETPTGVTEEERYTELLKSTCKEFTSNGEAITVNNGIAKQKVISGKIEGQTVKNIITVKQVKPFNMDGIVTPYMTFTTYFGLDSFNLTPNATYTLFLNVTRFVKSTGQLRFVCLNTLGETVFLSSLISPSSIGVYKLTFTVPNNVVLVKALSSNATNANYDYEFDNMMIVEGNGSGVNGFFTGLSSTQAVISNLGLKYSFYKDSVDKASGTVLTLGGVGGVYDTLEIKEDGSGTLTQNTKVAVLNGSENWVYLATSDDYLKMRFSIAVNDIKLQSNGKGDRFNWVTGIGSTNIDECIGSHISGGSINIVIKLDKLQTQDAIGLKTYLASNPITVRYQLATPIVTTIDKSLVPTIITQATNTFVFGDAVKPSKVTISVPVNRIADLETRLAQLEALVTSTSNLSLMANYVDDEYNNSLNQM